MLAISVANVRKTKAKKRDRLLIDSLLVTKENTRQAIPMAKRARKP